MEMDKYASSLMLTLMSLSTITHLLKVVPWNSNSACLPIVALQMALTAI
jgi:hypothetical protein